jgi:GTP-binding protein
LETLGTAAVSYQIVLTKADEPKQSDLDKRIAETQQKIAKRAAAFPEILTTSSRSGLGIPELRAGIARLLSERGAG